jgi:hypothetical protein
VREEDVVTNKDIDQLVALMREITPRTPGPCDPVRSALERAVRDIGERLGTDHTPDEMAAIINAVAARSPRGGDRWASAIYRLWSGLPGWAA